MPRNLLLLLLTGFLSAATLSVHGAVLQADTSAYQFQRLKINGLLAERSARFGQYDQSLNARTGIFGFQTKRDIKNSNEILRQIVLNDNNIFKELKILMDYKDQEVKQVMTNASSSNSRIESYMVAIKKLQDQRQKLREEVTATERAKDLAHYIILFLIMIMAAGSYVFMKKIRHQPLMK
ncbi:hypothetical protein PBAL39_00977 [Pedobacter sp. BAL39]|uniref:hypothetical protein n=1 Tax=Pedobacter sp. BAL39 TaxID=391596 RepID=UPI000155A0A5|nr:hypothetical protein [Pedobacter sp. BAL39]EDM38144.1 hypothetical protein PBAL39_00977 [Pedobacter sp. BAL39]